jgi:hypothetical protein
LPESAITQWPSLVMPTRVISYRSGLRERATLAAEARETSCSAERPPNRMATLSLRPSISIIQLRWATSVTVGAWTGQCLRLSCEPAANTVGPMYLVDRVWSVTIARVRLMLVRQRAGFASPRSPSYRPGRLRIGMRPTSFRLPADSAITRHRRPPASTSTNLAHPLDPAPAATPIRAAISQQRGES